MSDYDGGTKVKVGVDPQDSGSLYHHYLDLRVKRMGTVAQKLKSSVNVKICFITNIIKEIPPKSTSWKIPTQCNWRFTQRKSMLSAGQKVSFFVSDLRSRIQAL